MAKAIRHLALPGVMLLLALPISASVRLTGLRLQATEGERVLHNIRAESANLSDDRRTIEAHSLTLNANVETSREITTFAPRALITISNDGVDTRTSRETPGLPEIRHYAANFSTLAGEGDVFLLGDGEEILTTIGTDATLSSGEMIWSALYDQMLIPGPFRQTNLLPGGEVVITGEAMSVDHDFREWIYHSMPGSGIVLEYTANPVDATP